MIRLLVRVCAPFLLLCLASWAHAQELPRISEFYFDEDTLVARPIVAIEGDDEATIAKLVKTMERGGRHVDKAIAQLAHIAMASGRTDTGKVLYARAMDAASSSVMRNSIAWNHGWDLYRAGDYEGALEQWAQAFANRGAVLIPTREGEQGRFGFKCERGATFALTQLLYSDAIVGFLREFARTTEHRPEILLSFGFVPAVESKVGLINWLIQDPGNPVVAEEQAFVRTLAATDPEGRRKLMLDLYKRVIDGVVDLGFPLSIHLEATYGPTRGAFETFAELLAYWAPWAS